MTRSVPMTVSMQFSHSGVAALHRGLDLALTLPVPAVAGAGLRSLAFTFDCPAQPPSPTPEPPITPTKPCVQSLSSRYDDGAGTLQTHMTVHTAARQGKLPAIFLAQDPCENANSDAPQLVAHVRHGAFRDTDDDGNPARSTDASRPSVPA